MSLQRTFQQNLGGLKVCTFELETSWHMFWPDHSTTANEDHIADVPRGGNDGEGEKMMVLMVKMMVMSMVLMVKMMVMTMMLMMMKMMVFAVKPMVKIR